jgi:hypothetical protein
MVTIAMGGEVLLPKPIAIEGHNSDGWFGEIIEEPI